MPLLFPQLTMLPLERYSSLFPPGAIEGALTRFAELRAHLSGRVVWNVSSTAVSGGVAEMVRSMLAYARGTGVDARWVVVKGSPEFFRITKRLHNALHGSTGDGSPLGDAERQLFTSINATNAAELAPMVRPNDVVIVHDPQPAGMINMLRARGAHVIWRCHIGQDETNAETDRGWQFLAPDLEDADAYVFSRAKYIPACIDGRRAVLIPPTIDPFSPKNQSLADANVRAILIRAGLIQGTAAAEACTFVREDGSPGRVDRAAEIVRSGSAPLETTPLVVQVSRWDRLKDPSGVLAGFARLDETAAHGAHLVLAGPSVSGVADDPEGASVLASIIEQWLRLPENVRARVHLASIPTVDIDENAAIINALQRHAAVIVQKSLQEGFGLTVAEAMWKARPVVASAVGGIQDQVEDGVQGLLIANPSDLDAFAKAVERVLNDPVEARAMGERGHARVIERYLGFNALLRYGALIEAIDARSTRSSLSFDDSASATGS
jgi:trehalose synthase